MNPTFQTSLRNLALLSCALTASWPLTVLIHGTSMNVPAVVAITILVASGVVCRRFHLTGIVTLLTQSLVLVSTLVTVLAWRGFSVTPSQWAYLSADINKTVHTWSAPLPATAGVSAMVLTAALSIALAVDFVGGTAYMPLFAAVPITAPFVLAAAAQGHLLSVRYFTAAALAWACLVFFSTPMGLARLQDGWPNFSICAALTAIAVTASVHLTPHIPHRPTPTLGQRSGGGIDTSIDFSRSLDLRKSLHSKNSAPVLQYETTATHPSPLRVTTSSEYDDGIWKANALKGATTEVKPQTTLRVPGLDSRTPTTSAHTSVTLNGLTAPLVAAPAPLRVANFGSANSSFRLVTASGIPLVSHKPDAYAVLSYSFTSQARPTTDAVAGKSAASVTAADLDTSQLPSSTLDLVRQLTRVNGAEATAPFDKAVAIQRFLRVGGHYTYSLSVASADVGDKGKDPLAVFLTSKSGYCTQFATAMIMAARLEGIPARMAIGFLPGVKKAGQYQVHASDAHAWPELYFPGMGWTRFDPTPPGRSGSAPAYAPDSQNARSKQSTASQYPTPTSATPRNRTSTKAGSHPTSSAHHNRELKFVLTLVMLGLVVVVAVSILPLAGRRERERLLRKATTPEELGEGHWHEMRWCLTDLGLPLVPGRDPQTTLATFRGEHPGRSTELDDALAHAVDVIERARYSSTHIPADEAAMVMRRVVTTARQDAQMLTRLRAAVIPRSGLESVRRRLRRG